MEMVLLYSAGGRKYGRGRAEGHRDVWVLGGVCRETKEIFLDICPMGKEGYSKRGVH